MQVMGLFSGIGGFELGFRRAGFTIAGVCEIEPYACRVLEKHFPEARLYEDVKELTGERLRADGIRPFVVTGGFPCQDISLAGKGAGLGGERSGLWFEMHRVIAETRPRWVVAENVAALRSRGLDQVLGSLAAIGYDAEWHCIPASAVGAPHRRDRVWIVAYPNSGGFAGPRIRPEQPGRAKAERPSEVGQGRTVADADEHAGQQRRPGDAGEGKGGRDADQGAVSAYDVADARRLGLQRTESAGPPSALRRRSADESSPRGLGNPDQPRLEIRLDGHAGQQPAAVGTGWWQSEPDVGRVAHGVPARVDRLRALGNAVVPQIPEIIAHAIREYEFV